MKNTDERIIEKKRSPEEEQLLQLAREQLRRYAVEEDEIFDETAVEALVKLVQSLEGNQESTSEENQNAEAFWAYMEEREETTEIPRQEEKKGNKVVRLWRKSFVGRAAVIAASVLCLVLVGGVVGGAISGEGEGILHWIWRNELGTAVITIPDRMETNSRNVIYYEQLEDLPIEYQHYIVPVEDVKGLDTFELIGHYVSELSVFCRVSSRYIKGEDTVELGVMDYQNDIIITWEKYDDYEVLSTSDTGVYRKDILLKNNLEGEAEHIIVFYNDEIRCFVVGDIQLKELEQIADSYMAWVNDNM